MKIESSYRMLQNTISADPVTKYLPGRIDNWISVVSNLAPWEAISDCALS